MPAALRPHVLQWFHDSCRHPGISKSIATLKTIVYWPQLYKDLAAFINACPQCQLFKSSARKYGHISSTLGHSTPFAAVAIDILGPFEFSHLMEEGDETYPDEYKYCLTMIDLCTRWVELIPLQEISALTVTTAFDHNWLCRYPKPDKLVSDQGSQFTSNEFHELCESYDIQIVHTSTYNPTANSVCERVHGTINNSIRCAQNILWSQELPAIAWSLRTTFHRRLQCSPSQLVFGTSMLNPYKRIPIQKTLEHAVSYSTSQAESEARSNNKSRTQHSFEINDLVYVKNINPSKTQPRYSGPYPILKVYEEKNACKLNCGNFQETFSFRRLKPSL